MCTYAGYACVSANWPNNARQIWICWVVVDGHDINVDLMLSDGGKEKKGGQRNRVVNRDTLYYSIILLQKTFFTFNKLCTIIPYMFVLT